MAHQRRELGARPAPFGEFHGLLQARARLLAHQAGHGRLEGPRRDGDHPHPEPREVPRQRQRHGRHGPLGRRVGRLAHLPVEGRRRGHHHHDAALAVVVTVAVVAVTRGGGGLHEVWEELPDDVQGAAEVDIQDEVQGLKREGPVLGI